MLKKGKENNVCYILDSKLCELTGKEKEGFLFGLELELEGANVGMEGIPSKNWRRVEENSLRGENCEYVFKAPCEFKEAQDRVKKLFQTFKENGVKLHDSYRTSTHVHLNFSDKTVRQIVNFFLLHTVFEELFEEYCGETRKGNLFCLSCRDNEGLLDLMDDSLFVYGNFTDFGNNVRYNAANLAALNKFGSIEIRTMRGANSAEQVNDWLDILNQLYVFACSKDCPPPHKMCESLSHLGPMGFLRQCFDDKAVAKLLAAWPAVKDLGRSLMRGVRLVQMFSYKLQPSWEAEVVEKAPVKKKKDPFNLMGKMVIEDDPVEFDTDCIQIPGTGKWYVMRADQIHHGERTEVAGIAYYYNAGVNCWLNVVTQEPVRWTICGGRKVGRHSLVNQHYNDWHADNEDVDVDEGRGMDWEM